MYDRMSKAYSRTWCSRSVHRKNRYESKYKITCKEEIHDIVQNINSGHRELAIFMADVMVDLVYKNNKKITILIRKNKFKIDGVTYVSSDTILNTRLIHGKNNH